MTAWSVGQRWGIMLVLYTLATSVPDPLTLKEGQSGNTSVETPIAFNCSLQAGESLSLQRLKQMFPEKGEFHFRVKTKDPRFLGQFPARYVWQDVTRNEEELVPPEADPVVEVRALPINFTDGRWSTLDIKFTANGERSPISSISSAQYFSEQESESEYFELFQDGSIPASNTIHTRAKAEAEFSGAKGTTAASEGSWKENGAPRREVYEEDRTKQRSNKDAKAEEGMPGRAFRSYAGGSSSNAKAEGLFGKLGRSGVKFFKAGAKAAISLASDVSASQTAGYPTSAQKDNLEVVANMLSVSAGPDLLKPIWKVLFPSERFVARGPQWQVVGFKADDPLKDDNVVRGGILGLQSLCEFVQQYPSEAKRAAEAGVPIARMSLDVTLSLAVLLGLTDSSFATKKRPFWRLFNVSPLVFCTLSSYTTLISIRNHDRSKSHKTSVASAVRIAEHILGEAPADLQDVRSIGSALGLNYL